jgi:predicted transcriptional regulator
MAAQQGVHVPRLRALRNRRVVAVGELARTSGVSRFVIHHGESGGRIKHANVRALAEALDVEPAELCEAEEAAV